MALPVNLSTFTLKGKYTDFQGNALYGGRESVTVTYPTVANDIAAHTVLVPRDITVDLDVTGSFSIKIPVTEDPDLVPSKFTLSVRENFSRGRVLTFVVPDGTDTIWIDELAEGTPSNSGTVVYATFAALQNETVNRTTADTALSVRLEVLESVTNELGTTFVGLQGNQTIAGTKTFSSFPVGPNDTPTSDYQLTNKKFVEDYVIAHAGTSVGSAVPSGVVMSNLVGDGITLGGANCAAGTKTVTLTSGSPFVPGDVGKHVLLYGADSPGAGTFVGTIAVVNSGNSIDLDRNITTSVTNVMMCYGTDETAVFQADIDRAEAYALLHGGKVRLQVPIATKDHFVIAGPLLHTGQGNSQIVVPVWPTTGPKLGLEVVGSADGSPTQHWETQIPNVGGSTFVSYFAYTSASAQLSDINNYGHSSMIGGPTEPSGYTQTGRFNNVQVVLRDLQIRTTHTKDGIGIGAANLSSCASGGVERFGWGSMSTAYQRIDSVGSYANGIVVGLYLPTAGNNDLTYMSNATCHGGYTYTVWVSEHTDMFSVRLLYGWAGLCIVGTYWSSVGTTHGVSGFVSIEACTYFVYFIGAGSGGNGPYLHLALDTEGTLKIGDNNGGLASLSVTGQLYLMGEIDPNTFSTDHPIGFDVVLANEWYPNKGVSANWTVDTFTKLVVVDATAGNVTLSLPTADGRTKPITVVLGATASGHTCTLDPAGSETINGATTKVLSTLWDRVRVEPFAHNWVQTA